ncbi:MAG: ABC transporter substrate-binding protein [Deltaproteobacteria bacterium]
MNHLKMLFCWIAVVLIVAWAGSSMADEIVIGFTGPLSGPAAEYGQDIAGGIDMAVKEINLAGGIMVAGKKYTFKLMKIDDRIDPTQAVNNARRFQASKAVAVFNGIFTTIAPMLKINEEKGSEFILMAYTSTPKWDTLGNKLTVDVTMPFPVTLAGSADWALQKGYKKCAMVVTFGVYGDEWRSAFKTYWEKNGGTITADKPANYYTETDFSAPLSAALVTKPDVMLIGGPSATTALVIEQARGMGYKGAFILIDQANQEYIARLLGGTKVMGNLIGAAGPGSMPTPGAAQFAKKYSDQYKKKASWDCILNYTGTHALANAIVAAGTVTDIYKIRNAFAKTLATPMLGNEYPNEVFGIEPTGRLQVGGSIQTITDGKSDPPAVLVWWVKTQKEFEAVKKISAFKSSRYVWIK